MLKPPKQTAALKAQSVLVVDDEPEIRESVGRWLKFSGSQVLEAKDGVEGVEMAIEHSPQAIILDMQMPRMDGLSALRELRNHPLTLATPVIMLSASLREDQRALDAGATFFVQKPYEGKNLVSVVKAAIEQGHLVHAISDPCPSLLVSCYE